MKQKATVGPKTSFKQSNRLHNGKKLFTKYTLMTDMFISEIHKDLKMDIKTNTTVKNLNTNIAEEEAQIPEKHLKCSAFLVKKEDKYISN